MPQPNKHTKQIHDKGYKLDEFIEYWGITMRTYRNYCANEKLHDKLNKMTAGLPDRNQGGVVDNADGTISIRRPKAYKE